MGRPKGQRDSKPRTRRTKNQLTGKPQVAGIRRVQERSRKIKAQIKAIANDLILNDWYIKIGLGVSGIQLAVTFAYVTGSAWASAFSIVSAIGKAAFIEGGVWLINRTISHARAVRLHWAWQGVLWAVLFTLMWISMRANLRYEWEKKVEIKFPRGQCVLYRDDSVTCAKFEKININATNVDRFLSGDEQSDAQQRGGLIPLLVFASIIIGRVMLSAKDGFEAEETRRLRESERGADYRDRKKVAVRAKVEKAESVGLSVAEET